MMDEQIRFTADGTISMIWDVETDEPIRAATQDDMDTLPVGLDLTDDDLARCED